MRHLCNQERKTRPDSSANFTPWVGRILLCDVLLLAGLGKVVVLSTRGLGHGKGPAPGQASP
jgi:hypothetical protein